MDILNRCALAIRLPADIQAALGEAQLQIRRKAGGDLVRWTPTTELVLTVVSLGELGPGQIVQVDQTVRPMIGQCPALNLSLAKLGGSPTNLQPRFVWVGVEGDIDPLGKLNGWLEQTLTPILPDHEVREYHASVPLGRLKQESEQNRSALGRALRVAGIDQIGAFRATEVEMIRYAATGAGLTILTVNAYPLRV